MRRRDYSPLKHGGKDCNGTTTESRICNNETCKYLIDDMVWGISVGDIKNWSLDSMSKCCCDVVADFVVNQSTYICYEHVTRCNLIILHVVAYNFPPFPPSTFQGEELRVNLAITGSAGGQEWEDSLLEERSPKAKQFVKRTRGELNLLMKLALGEKMLNFR